MKTKNKFFLIAIPFFLVVCSYFTYQFINKSTHTSLVKTTPEFIITADELVNTYSKNEAKSNTLYAGKIIEITGIIKEITFLNDRTTVILKSNSETFGVICDVNPNQQEKFKQLKQHQRIKGG